MWGLEHALLALAVGLPGAYVAIEGLRAVTKPERWPSRTNRWIVSLRWPREPRPAAAEIRFWDAVWAVLGGIFVALAFAAFLP
jgi:hypothetical protein